MSTRGRGPTAALLALAVAAAPAAALAGCGSSDGDGGSPATRPAPAGVPPEDATAAKEAADALAKQRAETARLRKKAEKLRKEADTATAAPSQPDTGGSGGGLLSSADRASFTALEKKLGGTSGIAVSKLGPGQDVASAGSLTTGVAWSSIKVPIAAAVVRKDGGTATSAHQALMVRAITASDNDAATALWSSLGSPSSAGSQVEQILSAAGDDGVDVSTTVKRAGFTPFGQTEWSLADQARFMAGFSCVPESQTVLSLMGQVVADQRWGLGTTGGTAQFKGGWGPGAGGGYLVRQFGEIGVDGGKVAVAVATLPSDGAFGTGTSNLSQIAAWAKSHVSGGGAASC